MWPALCEDEQDLWRMDRGKDRRKRRVKRKKFLKFLLFLYSASSEMCWSREKNYFWLMQDNWYGWRRLLKAGSIRTLSARKKHLVLEFLMNWVYKIRVSSVCSVYEVRTESRWHYDGLLVKRWKPVEQNDRWLTASIYRHNGLFLLRKLVTDEKKNDHRVKNRALCAPVMRGKRWTSDLYNTVVR